MDVAERRAAFLHTVFDVEPTGLVICTIRVRSRLAERAVGHPDLDVIFLRSDAADIARTDVHDAVVQAKGLIQLFGVSLQLFVDAPRLLRKAEDELLDFVELMHAKEAFRVLAVSADFAAEARADAGELERQSLLLDDVVHMHGRHRMLRGRYQIEILGASDGGHAY